MPTEKQRREAARRHLERQVQRRAERELQRRRMTLIGSISGTLVLIVVVIVFIVATGNDNKKKTPAASSATGTTTTTSTTSTTPTATPTTSSPPVRAAKGPSVTFKGVTVVGATDLGGSPKVTSKATTDPTALEYKDLVVGKGTAATPTSTVAVQYTGVLYKTGTAFDSSWKNNSGQPASFSLTGVVPGFTEGIGGFKTIPAMKVGGRRIIIVPSDLGYGSSANGSIPANSTLVFVIDLTKVS